MSIMKTGLDDFLSFSLSTFGGKASQTTAGERASERKPLPSRVGVASASIARARPPPPSRSVASGGSKCAGEKCETKHRFDSIRFDGGGRQTNQKCRISQWSDSSDDIARSHV